MKKLIAITTAAILGAASAGFADDLNPPPWRQSEATTYQRWDFSTPDNMPVPDSVYNPYGTPALRVKTDYQWSDGVWPLSGEIDVYIPNYPPERPEKWIWLQLTWKPEDLCPDPFLPDEPIVGVVPFDSMEMSKTQLNLDDGWKHTTFKINLYPNPSEEWISIKGDIKVDQVVIDTRCIPEPATLALLGAGALMVVARRRRAV